jgi:hypothetical protein
MKDREWCAMENGMDRYIGRCLKNWTAKYQPPIDGRAKLVGMASQPAITRHAHPLSERFSTFLNRSSAVDDQFYYPRQWQITGPFTQSLIFSFHMVANQRMAN